MDAPGGRKTACESGSGGESGSAFNDDFNCLDDACGLLLEETDREEARGGRESPWNKKGTQPSSTREPLGHEAPETTQGLPQRTRSGSIAKRVRGGKRAHGDVPGGQGNGVASLKQGKEDHGVAILEQGPCHPLHTGSNGNVEVGAGGERIADKSGHSGETANETDWLGRAFNSTMAMKRVRRGGRRKQVRDLGRSSGSDLGGGREEDFEEDEDEDEGDDDVGADRDMGSSSRPDTLFPAETRDHGLGYNPYPGFRTYSPSQQSQFDPPPLPPVAGAPLGWGVGGTEASPRGMGGAGQNEIQLLQRRARNRKHAKETRRRKKETIDAMQRELEELREMKRAWDRGAPFELPPPPQQMPLPPPLEAAAAPGVNVPSIGTPGADDGEGVLPWSMPTAMAMSAAVGSEKPCELMPVALPAAQRERWCERVCNVLRLRAVCERSAAAWAEHCEPNVELVLPFVPYRSHTLKSKFAVESRCTGISGLIADAQSLAVALAAIAEKGIHRAVPTPPSTPPLAVGGRGFFPPVRLSHSIAGHRYQPQAETSPPSPPPEPGSRLRAEAAAHSSSYEGMKSSRGRGAEEGTGDDGGGGQGLRTDGMHFNATGVMCTFQLRSLNLVTEHKCRCEVVKFGTLKAVFHPTTEKVTLLEFSFDAISFWRQIQHASLTCSEQVGGLKFTPNLLSSALRPTAEARMVVTSDPPLRVCFANDRFRHLINTSAQKLPASSAADSEVGTAEATTATEARAQEATTTEGVSGAGAERAAGSDSGTVTPTLIVEGGVQQQMQQQVEGLPLSECLLQLFGATTPHQVLSEFLSDCHAQRPSSMTATRPKQPELSAGGGSMMACEYLVQLCPLQDDTSEQDDLEAHASSSVAHQPSTHLLLIIKPVTAVTSVQG